MNMTRGNCYVTVEAIYHLTGGKDVWIPQVMHWRGGTHWFLKHRRHGFILDPTAKQFKHKPTMKDYAKARGCGFLTKKPSQRARNLMLEMLWQV